MKVGAVEDRVLIGNKRCTFLLFFSLRTVFWTTERRGWRVDGERERCR